MLNSTASPLAGPPHFVDLHVNPGESVSIQLFDGNETILRGPATITMISQHAYPPMPIPVQVPPGHMIQQIVDENGQLRHIILSAVPNNGTANPSNTVLMPQQQQPAQHQQQQQPFPYCCCCCYSCTGTTPTAPLPPAPPPPPQLHHNILAFPTPPNRRRLNPINRTFSAAGKRSAPTFLNNNSIGKSPIRNKLGSPVTAPLDSVSKMFGNRATTPDGKPYELNSNRVLVGKMSTNENNFTQNCQNFSDSRHVINKNYISNEAIDRGVNSKEFLATNGPLLSTPRPVPPFSYTSLEEHKNVNHPLDRNNCSHYDPSDKPPFLLEINLSSADPRAQNNLSSDIVEEVEEEEEQTEQKEDNCHDSALQKRLEVPDISLTNDSEDSNRVNQSETQSSQSKQSNEESLRVRVESTPDLTKDTTEDKSEELITNTPNASQPTNSCISPPMQDNHRPEDPNQCDDKSSDLKSSEEAVNGLWSHSKQQLIDSSESINLIECQLDKREEANSVCEEIDNSIDKSSEEITIQNNDSIKRSTDDETEVTEETSSLATTTACSGAQRSPKHLLPQLQLLNLTYTSLTANTVKLKWAHSQPNATPEHLYAKHYVVEMLLNKSGGESASAVESGAESQPSSNSNSRVVYQGHSNNCRIAHLMSQQQYAFRVRTTSDSNEHLVVSNVLTITTPEQQPITTKASKKSKRELLHQQIQQQQHQIHQQQLLLQQQQQLQQTQTRGDVQESGISADQRCAILLLLLFSLFALIVAVLIQQLLSD